MSVFYIRIRLNRCAFSRIEGDGIGFRHPFCIQINFVMRHRRIEIKRLCQLLIRIPSSEDKLLIPLLLLCRSFDIRSWLILMQIIFIQHGL